MSKKHNVYQAYGPEEAWTDRPRVIIYARRHQNAFCIEKREHLLRNNCLDILAIEVKVKDRQEPIHLMNVQNAPHGCTREEETVTNVMNLASLIQKHTIIAGDFNLHNGYRDQRTINPTPQARKFAEWATTNRDEYGLTSGTIIHQQGGTIDLVITSGSLASQIIECYTDNNLDVTSDHKVIITTVELGGKMGSFSYSGQISAWKTR